MGSLTCVRRTPPLIFKKVMAISLPSMQKKQERLNKGEALT